jgi:hypothetical protein
VLSGDEILRQLEGMVFRDKNDGKSKLEGKSKTDGKKKWKKRKKTINKRQPRSNHIVWKKKRIFFRLLYLKDNLLWHNLNVMHIEKNVMDNILGTILDIKGKTKDNLEARKDLYEMGDLHFMRSWPRIGRPICYQLPIGCQMRIKLIS